MQLSEPVVDVVRKRLKGRTERVCRATGLGGFGGFLFGFAFVAAGTPITLIGLKIIPVDPSGVHAPYWVIGVIGAVFASAGFMVWGMVLKELVLSKRREALAARHPRTEVFKDYPWDIKGVRKSPWSAVWKSFGSTVFLAAFLAPFNWWAWLSDDGRIGIKVIVSLFDAFLIMVLVELVRRILVAIKYGPSRLEYSALPCETGSCVGLRWLPPGGLEAATKITFVLRALEEWTESTGSGKNRSTRLIHEQLWATTRETEGDASCRAGRPLSIEFDVPAEAPGTDLAAKLRIRYWELEVTAEAPGVDFSERYMVPVYAPGVA